MYRTNQLIIRLYEYERRAIDLLAHAERLPTSTLARQMLLKEADRRGIPTTLEEKASGSESE